MLQTNMSGKVAVNVHKVFNKNRYRGYRKSYQQRKNCLHCGRINNVVTAYSRKQFTIITYNKTSMSKEQQKNSRCILCSEKNGEKIFFSFYLPSILLGKTHNILIKTICSLTSTYIFTVISHSTKLITKKFCV